MAQYVDASDVYKLAGVLAAAGHVANEEAQAVVKRGAQNIKRDWANRSRGIAHAPRYPRSIGYDVTSRTNDVEATIGPEDSPVNQGFLGPILEFGGAHNNPRNDGGGALDAEEPRFLEELGKVVGDTIA